MEIYDEELKSIDFKTRFMFINYEKYEKTVNDFLTDVENGNYNKEDVDIAISRASSVYRYRNRERIYLNRFLHDWDHLPANPDEIYKEYINKYKTKEEVQNAIENLEAILNEWRKKLDQLTDIKNKGKNFNKKLCFSNIRELLKNSDVKIGQIEREAGLKVGYIARLEKDDNTAEPSMEFIMTASKMLKISIDTLVSIDLTDLTPSEKYLIDFFGKLKSDTLLDKLDWFRTAPKDFDQTEVEGHPLFEEEECFINSGCEYPDVRYRYIFYSNTFGPDNVIKDDCFSLRLKNNVYVYLMNIEKKGADPWDDKSNAIEVWMSIPSKKNEYLLGSQDQSSIAKLVEELYSTVKQRMEQPKINNAALSAIDSFMRDDFADDPEELPF